MANVLNQYAVDYERMRQREEFMHIQREVQLSMQQALSCRGMIGNSTAPPVEKSLAPPIPKVQPFNQKLLLLEDV